MIDELTAVRPDPALNANVTQLHGDGFLGHIYHRTRRTHSSVLIGKIANRDRGFDVAEAIESFSEKILGKEPEDNILNAFDRMKDISK